MWGIVSYLRKQHDGRDWASNQRPSDLKSKALTTTPPRPVLKKLKGPVKMAIPYDTPEGWPG